MKRSLFPTYFEVRYGMKPLDFQESEISTEEPVPLKIGEKTVNLRGRIDRIDLTKDGKRARVRDYKTGKSICQTKRISGWNDLTASSLSLCRQAVARSSPQRD